MTFHFSFFLAFGYYLQGLSFPFLSIKKNPICFSLKLFVINQLLIHILCFSDHNFRFISLHPIELSVSFL